MNILYLLVACGYGYVIPRDDMEASEYSGGPDGFPNQDDQLDINVMFIYLGSMLVMYLFICIIYFTTKIVVTRLLTMHARVSLLNEDGVSGGRLHGRSRVVESAESRWPSVLDDEELVRDKLRLLTAEEQFYYKQGEEFIKQNPPLIIPDSGVRRESGAHASDAIINEQTRQYIEEEGALAWEFQPNQNLPNDTIIVENKTEISFLNFNYDASVTTNLPIPCINRVYYCEFKIFELSLADNQTSLKDNELISFGLSTSPYPYFRLPGRHHHSIAYDSSGARRFNDSFILEEDLANIFPKCEKGDIIGIGYRTRSGTVFFTRNGKKLNEKPIGGHIKGWRFKYLYPIVGANVPCKIHANFGSYGFVFIEANVKKWGYAKPNGLKMPPPSYEDYVQDTLLESGYEDNDHSDNESDDDSGSEQGTRYRRYKNTIIDDEGNLLPPPPGFEFSTSPQSVGLNEEINLDSLPAEPPNYSDDEIRAMKGEPTPRISVGRSRDYLLDDGEVREGKSRMLEDFAGQDEDEDEYADSEEDYEANIDELQAMIESGSIESGSDEL
ncbi:Protein SSH4 [Nakaseomyces bracarensis]|uniref:Protein SSH4 n=1 Tax=Nakaseomyces bracarensis TaxID=273131 RepID=A0ABR4P0E2_9SACH